MADGEIAIFPEALADVAAVAADLQGRAGGDALRVLMLLLAGADLENVVRTSVEEISVELGIKPWRVDRAILLLIGLRAIRRDARGIAVSPCIAWKGQPYSERHASAVDAWV